VTVLVLGVFEEVIINVPEKHAGRRCFGELDHDVTWMKVSVNKIIEK
jgi:hypothetical protein